MATYYVDASFEEGTLFVSGGGSSGNPKQILATDTIVVSRSGSSSGTVYFTGFSSLYFDNTSNVTFGSAGSSSKSIKDSSPLNSTFFITVDHSSTGSQQVYFKVISSVDTTPDAFDLGTNKSGANPNSDYYASQITISGINTAVTASATNGALVSKNNGSYLSSVSVTNGDKIRLRLKSSTAYATTKSTVLTVGGTTDSWSVTTFNDPETGQLIDIGVGAGSISLSRVKSFFAGDNAPNNLRSYLKGGAYVPNISANSAIPASGVIKLTNFYNAKTSFYISKSPPPKVIQHHTVNNGGGTFQLSWSIPTDWDLGYGARMKDAALFKYAITKNALGNGASTSHIIVSSAIAYSSYSKSNNYITVQVTVPSSVERDYFGEITIYAKHELDASIVAVGTMSYAFYFFGL